MLLFPAIDLKEGKCVRLYKGDMDKSTIFNDSPAAQAKSFQLEGADWVHIVDLDGAFAGESVNGEAVKSILEVVDIPVQLGGGIRTLENIKEWLDLGVSRVILGTVAVKNPQLVIEACRKFPNKIAVGLDAYDGFVATEGWAEKSSLSVIEMAAKFEDAGVSAIIYTDISKDGAMQGADFDGTEKLVNSTLIPIILSGGISSIEDLEKARQIENLYGVISGRAIYEKAFTVKEAKEILF